MYITESCKMLQHEDCKVPECKDDCHESLKKYRVSFTIDEIEALNVDDAIIKFRDLAQGYEASTFEVSEIS